MEKTRTTIRLEEQDREAIAAIKAYYGITSDNDAIRFALRKVQREIRRQTSRPASEASLGIPPQG